MRKIFFRLKIITKWLRAVERAARYKRQRDVLHKHFDLSPYEPMPNELVKVLDEIEGKNATPRE